MAHSATKKLEEIKYGMVYKFGLVLEILDY